MTLLLTLSEAAQQLRLSPSTLKNPATRARLGIDVAVVKMGRRTLLNPDILRQILGEIAGGDVPTRKAPRPTA